MIESVVKMFRGIVGFLIVAELIAVLIFGIMLLGDNYTLGLIILVGGTLGVIIANGFLCTFLVIADHLKNINNLLVLSMKQTEIIQKTLAPKSETVPIPVYKDYYDGDKETTKTKDIFTCEICKAEVGENDTVCPKCGIKFDE